MQNESNREWLLPARLKVQRLASEAESARVFGLEVQAETHSHVAKIRELNERVEKLTDERAYFARMVGTNTSNDISRIDRELKLTRGELNFYEQALADARQRFATVQHATGTKGELARAARAALERIEGTGSGIHVIQIAG